MKISEIKELRGYRASGPSCKNCQHMEFFQDPKFPFQGGSLTCTFGPRRHAVRPMAWCLKHKFYGE